MPERDVAIVYFSDPFARLDGGSRRLIAYVEAFRRLGFSVRIVYPPSGVKKVTSSGVARGLALAGKAKRYFLPMPLRRPSATRAIIRELKKPPGANFIVSMAPPLLGAVISSDPKFLWSDVMDLWSAFATREARARKGLAALTSRGQALTLAWRERTEYQRATFLTTAGKQDEVLVGNLAGNDRVRWLPTPVIGRPRSFRRRSGRVAGMLANFSYWPNADAFRKLVESWLPVLLKEGWEVVVAGHGSEALSRHAGIRSLGPIQDLDSFYSRIDLALAPVRLGGGMKVKVVEALCYGVPVVCLPEAAEGLPTDILAGVTISREFSGQTLVESERSRATDISAALEPFTHGFFYKSVEDLCRAGGLL